MATPVTGSKALRKDIADKIKPNLPANKYAIFPTASGKNEFTKPTILIERSELVKMPAAPLGLYQSTFDLYIVSNQKVADEKEDYLDDLCDEVLEALEDAAYPWQTATRAVFNGTNPCYKVSLVANSYRKRTTS